MLTAPYAPTLFPNTIPPVRHAGTDRASSPSMSEATIDVMALAAAAGVTDRTIRRWVRQGLLESPQTVAVEGTALKLRRWPQSAIAAARQLAEQREIWLRR